ncbi:TIR domain-containing protein [Actinobacillus equuli subsp. equuli]|uniref:TIR domain-containing protein n=1 Tax=Actinobacillus equuli subsp. equuli TaxID=202947 RepID=A0A9X4JC60_ACTEU|nr:TIR domain-containing protein [Actinobacillus equuli]MDE8034482.1 TIR domain-containing protein [Actinobacillus equuli subsp. equuli]MDG4947529.1 TIR domain-containing protein [Actinobacillus equuli subsp. haemolyticus]
MGNKVFISYKYSDDSVKQLTNPNDLFAAYRQVKTTARDYVDIIQKKFERDGIHINKGENDNESLADFKTEYIRSKLADKIFDSSVTIVLISPNMKDVWKSENDQWIPWEIAYSLKNKTRSDNRSKRNAILAVILPDRYGRYDYVNSYGFYFKIIQRNLDNLHTRYDAYKLKNGCSDSYILRCNWDNFISNPNGWIEAAIEIRNKGDKYNIVVRP